MTLIEVAAVIVVLALSVPPAVAFMNDAANRRIDSVMVQRCNAWATAILEQAISDAVTADPGSNVATYVETATTGLRARMASIDPAYTGLGMSWTMTLGSSLVGPNGTATGNAAQDKFRIITVTISFKNSAGATINVPFDVMVSVP